MEMWKFLELMQDDIRNEYKHLHFYLHSAMVVQGLHREEMSEFFLEEAQSEMAHVKEFGDMIVGIFDVIPDNRPHDFPIGLTDLRQILEYVVKMEQEVVENYHLRMKQAEELGTSDGSVLHVFYEEQIADSKKTVMHVKQMLKGI